MRNIARLRAGYLLVDNGSYDDVAERVEPLRQTWATDAQSVLGLAAWKAERFDDAAKLFKLVAEDSLAPANARQRANTMLTSCTARGVAAQG